MQVLCDNKIIQPTREQFDVIERNFTVNVELMRVTPPTSLMQVRVTVNSNYVFIFTFLIPMLILLRYDNPIFMTRIYYALLYV